MNQTSFPFQPSRFASLRATTPVPVSWETIVNELTGPFHKAQTELYRQTIARLHQAEQDNDNLLLPKLKAEKEQIKQAEEKVLSNEESSFAAAFRLLDNYFKNDTKELK